MPRRRCRSAPRPPVRPRRRESAWDRWCPRVPPTPSNCDRARDPRCPGRPRARPGRRPARLLAVAGPVGDGRCAAFPAGRSVRSARPARRSQTRTSHVRRRCSGAGARPSAALRAPQPAASRSRPDAPSSRAFQSRARGGARPTTTTGRLRRARPSAAPERRPGRTACPRRRCACHRRADLVLAYRPVDRFMTPGSLEIHCFGGARRS